jgi:hypothetical protein
MRLRKMRLYQCLDEGRFTLSLVATAGIRVMWEVRHLMQEDVFTIRKCNRKTLTIVDAGALSVLYATIWQLSLLEVLRIELPIGYSFVLTGRRFGGRNAELTFRGRMMKRSHRYHLLKHSLQTSSASAIGLRIRYDLRLNT